MAEVALNLKKCILCVDDNERGLLIRKEMLEVFGFAVELATSGNAALALIEQKNLAQDKFDVVVLDYRMPEMDGAELTDRIKALYPGTCIVMLTGYPQEIPLLTREAVDALLVKGERPEKLLNTLLRLTGAERRLVPMNNEQLRRRNTDHVQAVKQFLREDIHRKQ